MARSFIFILFLKLFPHTLASEYVHFCTSLFGPYHHVSRSRTSFCHFRNMDDVEVEEQLLHDVLSSEFFRTWETVASPPTTPSPAGDDDVEASAPEEGQRRDVRPLEGVLPLAGPSPAEAHHGTTADVGGGPTPTRVPLSRYCDNQECVAVIITFSIACSTWNIADRFLRYL